MSQIRGLRLLGGQQAARLGPGTLSRALMAAAGLAGVIGITPGSRIDGPFDPSECRGQPPAAPEEQDDEPDDASGLDSGLYLPVDRQLQRTLATAQRMTADARWSDAATLLDEILASDSDSFAPPSNAAAGRAGPPATEQSTLRSVKTLAEEAIAGMAREGREAYELQFRAKAERALHAALEQGDISGVVSVARRWFHTPAGAAAALLVAIDRLESADNVGAAHWLARLGDAPGGGRFEPTLSVLRAVVAQRSGDRKSAESLLEKARRGRRTDVRIAGRDESLVAASGLAVDWLEKRFGRAGASSGTPSDDWLLVRGNAARNALAADDAEPAGGGDRAAAPSGLVGDAAIVGPRPLLAPRYRVPLARHPEEARGWERRRRSLVDRDAARMPSASPLAVGQRVLAMSPGGLLAIDFRSGKRMWLAANPFPEAEPSTGSMPDAMRQTGIEFDTVFDDATSGGLASDGRLVFAVESPPVPVTDPTVVFQGGMGANVAARPENALSAYHIETGALVWRLPRSAAGDRKADDAAPFAGWIVGPPLPAGDELFVLLEHQGGLRLDAIEAATGTIRWSQPLADLDDDLAVLGGRGAARRVSGLSPSMADGVLVCPTGAGAVIAVDLSTRTLRWAYRYATSTGDAWMRMGNGMLVRRGNGMVAVMPGQGIPVAPNDPSSRRRDGQAVIADGRVVIAPRESGEIHCLDLATGSVCWRRSAETCLYIAGIHDGRVIVVGQHSVEARRLSDGADAWRAPVSLGESSPSGRGFLSRERLYLPLETPEVMEIDQATGRVVGRSPSRNGGIPGNLVAHRGEVISQGVESLDVFHQTRTLLRGIEAADGDDGWNAYWLGQLLLDAGRIADGLASVWRAHEIAPETIGSDMVAESVLFGLRRDFATAARYWRRSVTEPSDAVAEEILRYVVDGALAAGDAAEAWDAFRRIAKLGIPADGDTIPPRWQEDTQGSASSDDRLVTDPTDVTVSCSPDRWIRGRLRSLRAVATGPLAEEIESSIARALDRSLPADGGADEASALRVWRFLERFGGTDDTTRAALAFLANGPVASPKTGRPDDGRLRRDLARLKLFRLSAAPVPIGDRTTAPAEIEGVQAAADASWPMGRVAVEHIGQSANGRAGQRLQRPSRIIPIPCQGIQSPAPDGLGLGPVRLSIDTQAGNAVVVSDGFGRRIGEPLAVDEAAGRFAMVAAMQPSIADASVLGRLVMVRFGSTLAGFEVGAAGNRRLWSRADSGSLPIQINRQVRVVVRRNAGIPLGMRPAEPADAASTEGDVQAGQAVTDGVPILSQRTLEVCDPLTGRTVWSRSKLPAAAEIFGDETCVVICPRDGRRAVVLSMIDGRVLATRDLPPRDRRLTIAGRTLVSIEAAVDAPRPVDAAGPDAPSNAERLAVSPSAGVTLVAIDPLTDRRLALGDFSADARATPLDPGGLAVLEPGGRFTIIDVLGGAARFSVRLDSAPDTIEQVHVLPWRDRLLVAVGRPETPEEQRRLEGIGTISGVPSGGWQATEETTLLTGSVWCLDRATGDPIWPVPATLLRHGLPLHQPQDLPLLTFVRQIHAPAGEDRPRLSVLCLDKRTGHAVYDDDRAGTDHHPLFSSEIVGTPESHSVDISRGADRVRLVFDGRPIPPQAPYQATATPAHTTDPLGAIGREFEKWLQRAFPSLPF